MCKLHREKGASNVYLVNKLSKLFNRIKLYFCAGDVFYQQGNPMMQNARKHNNV